MHKLSCTLFLLFSLCLIKKSNLHILKDEEIPLLRNTVTLPFVSSLSRQIFTTLCIGTPPQCLVFKVATNINESFLLDSPLLNKGGFKSEDSSSLIITDGTVNFTHASISYKGYITKDVLTIPNSNVNIPEFTFFLATEGNGNKLYEGVLGLGKMVMDSQFSFISDLYLNDYIQNIMFGISYDSIKKDKGKITFGYIDTLDKLKYKSCEILDNDSTATFDTTLDGIIYYNENSPLLTKVYHSPQSLFFSPGANKIYCPANFFYFLIGEVFKQYIDKDKICYTEEEAGTYESLSCTESILRKQLGELNFIFGKWSVSLNILDLFLNCGDNEYCLQIVLANDESKWVFGTPFLQFFPIVFDVDDNLIKIQIN